MELTSAAVQQDFGQTLNRRFAVLAVCEWLAAIAATVVVSPYTWAGDYRAVHPHLWFSLGLGGLVASLPVLLMRVRPQPSWTKHVNAAAQMLMAGLLVHTTGGRIETHFAYFGLLAFLSFYRDRNVLATATAVAGLDHVLRALLWPESMYGVSAVSLWRAFEHTAWVLFEVLLLSDFISRAERQSDRAGRERDRMEMQLRHAQKLESIGQLASGIAHEINTPTQYVGDNLHFLAESARQLDTLLKLQTRLLESLQTQPAQASLAAELQEAIEQADIVYLRDEIPAALAQASEGVSRIATLVRAMKEFSHPGGKAMAPHDLNKAILNTVTVARNEWKYHADVDFQLDESLPSVPCFVSDFNQVILNLVVNAAHAIAATKPGTKGVITIRTSPAPDSDAVEVRVSDTGCGIPLEAQNHIFEPFFTTKPVGQGTGQGLAISRSIVVDKHHGSIRFETEVGKGTTFIIQLPCSHVSRAVEEQGASVA